MELQRLNGKWGEIKSHTELRGLALFLLMFYRTNPWRHISLRPVNTFLNHGLPRLIGFARKSPRELLQLLRCHLEDYGLREMDWYWKVHNPGNDRTVYIIGLFGTGRTYINELVRQNIGERAKYFRDKIRFHPGPTSLIYSGHATIKHECSHQQSPTVTRRVLEAVGSRSAYLIFLYRHPLDSLLSNWIWWRNWIPWRTFRRHRFAASTASISGVYKNTDDLCADLEQNFLEFKAFAEGDPDFFSAVPGARFLSFPEFLEETELYLQSATLTLRLEDFAMDPLKEFSKIVDAMSVDLDLNSLHVVPPRAEPYRYLAVKEKVPRFRDFIDGLDAKIKGRIEKIGYNVGI